MTLVLGILIGVLIVVILRIAVTKALLIKLRADVAALGSGDYGVDTRRIIDFDRKLAARGL